MQGVSYRNREVASGWIRLKQITESTGILFSFCNVSYDVSLFSEAIELELLFSLVVSRKKQLLPS